MAAKKTVRNVRFEDIFADYSRNWRHAWKYKVVPKENFNPEKDVPGFYEDILMNGIATSIEVAELTEEQKDVIEKHHGFRPEVRVIRGHRRFLTATRIRESDSSLFKELSCIVYKGLTEREEFQLMFDTNGIEPLDEFEIYRAVKKLYGQNLSQEQIGVRIGQKKNWVQDRIYIMELPPCVEAEYLKRFTPLADGSMPKKGVDYTFFTHDDVDIMHKNWNADKEARIPADSPASQFRKTWEEISTKTKPPGDPTSKKALTKAVMDKTSGLVSGREPLEEAFRYYSGNGGNIADAAEKYDAVFNTASKVPALESEVSRLKRQVSELTVLLDEKNVEIALLTEQLVPVNNS